MNYSKDSRVQAEQKNNPKKKQKKKKGKVTAFRIILMACIIGLFAVVGGGLGIVIGIIKSTPDASSLQLKPTTNFSSFVYDKDGKQIDSFSPADNRIYATLDQIPLNLQHAFIALEDERFYEHNGIDIKGIFRAIYTNLKNRGLSEGASTITQQLIKNNILTSDKKFTRKIQEQYLAIEFEKLYPKSTILEYYLNTIALGQGVSGVQAAATRYFNKDVSELTLTECAVIAVITQAPTKYNPIKNPEANWEKVQVALQKMYEQGYITEEEKATALEENPYINIQQVHEEFAEKSTHSYFVDKVFKEVINDLQSQKGLTSTQATNLVYGGGLQIYTTMDSDMQAIADQYLNDESLYPSHLYELQIDYSVSITKKDGTQFTKNGVKATLKSEDEIDAFKAAKLEEWGISEDEIADIKESIIKQPQPQAAFVLSDYSTGQVRVLAGGRGEKTNLGFNYATDAKRQPGSTFKVLAAYAPALDLGKLSPGSILIDEPISIPLSNGKTYSPSNWSNDYEGPTSVRRAIYRSMNVLAVKTVYELVGVETAYNYLLNFGFTTLTEQDKVYALPLGGITEGVTAVELNAAYGTIANDGVYVKPIYYTQVLDDKGNVLLDNTTSETLAQNSHTVIKASTAQMLTDMMQDVVTIGTGASLKNTFSSMPVAGKTGTTTDDKDLVFSAYTPYYAATIWTGYDQPKPLSRASNYHLTLWGKIMNDIHANLEYKAFPKVTVDTEVQQVKVCTLSGKLATHLCEEDPDHVVKTDYFTSQNAPTETCDIHVEVDICNVSGKIVNEYCPPETHVKTSIIRKVVNGTVVADEICDVHGPDTVVDETPEVPDLDEWPDYPSEIPDSSEPPTSTIVPSVPTPTPSVTPTPSLPPVTSPNPSPNPDDEDTFFVPQE